MINMFDVTTISDVEANVSDGKGTYDKMMVALRAQLNDAVSRNELTQEEAGKALAEAAIALMGTAVQFEMGRERTDAEINQIKRRTI